MATSALRSAGQVRGHGGSSPAPCGASLRPVRAMCLDMERAPCGARFACAARMERAARGRPGSVLLVTEGLTLPMAKAGGLRRGFRSHHLEAHPDGLGMLRVAAPLGEAELVGEQVVELISVVAPKRIELGNDVGFNEPAREFAAVDVVADEVVALGRSDEEDEAALPGGVLDDLQEPQEAAVLAPSEAPELKEVPKPVGA